MMEKKRKFSSSITGKAVSTQEVRHDSLKPTKQQKRDAKRASGLSPVGALQTKMIKDDTKKSEICEETVPIGDVVPFDDTPTTKLTKQQKRDAKRAGAKISEQPRNNNIIDSCGSKKPISGSSVYKRVPILPADSPFPHLNVDRFLIPTDKHFQKVLETCYDGFLLDKPESYSEEFHKSFSSCFEKLDSSGFFQFDMTQPAGLDTKVARTFVTRCLVGEPGITYKYLGLRMFSYPWDGSDDCDTFKTIGQLNKQLAERTDVLLKNTERPETGSCNFNLTLINRCYPINGEVKMKLEPTFQKEKCTVSWHADSTLEHYSSIAVYHCTKALKTKKNPSPKNDPDDASWRISLRVCPNAEGPKAGKLKNTAEGVEGTDGTGAPPLAVPLPTRWSYYLLDDFNHHHQHSVLAGKTDRYASTHRVSRTDGHTFLSVKSKCLSALQGSGACSKQVRTEQLVLNELEFEWIRQFYIQGARHLEMHKWWHSPMAELLDLWRKLESRSKILLQTLKDASEGMGLDSFHSTNSNKMADNKQNEIRDKQSENRLRKTLVKRAKRASAVTAASYEAAIEGYEERMIKRKGWAARALDPAFQTVPLDCKPLPVPFMTPTLTTDPTSNLTSTGDVSGLKNCSIEGETEGDKGEEYSSSDLIDLGPIIENLNAQLKSFEILSN